MKMLNLSRLATFVAVVDAGSFTAAAAALGQTKAVVSFNLRQLEAELGVTLLLRSTRRLTLTDAGERLYQRSLTLLKDADALREEVQASHQGFSGELRVTTTPEYANHVVGPALAAFSRAHPSLRIRHFSSSQPADLISQRVDVAIRLGTLQDSAYRAALISRFAIFPVASPQWLERHPVSSLAVLSEADWLVHTRLSSPLRWALTGPDSAPAELDITRPPAIAADSAGASAPGVPFSGAGRLCGLPRCAACVRQGAGVYRFSARPRRRRAVALFVNHPCDKRRELRALLRAELA